MKKIGIYESFAALPPSHQALFAQASVACGVFHSLAWFENLADTALQAQALRIFCVESDGGKKADLILPLCAPRAAPGFLAPRQLNAAANFYTSLFGPVFDGANLHLQQDLRLLVDTVAAQQPAWDTVDLHPMDAAAPTFSMLAEAFSQTGMRVQRYFCFGNWYLDVGGRSYQEYFNTLPSQLKNTLTRRARMLDKENRLQIRIFIDPAEMSEAVRDFQAIYGASWKTPEPYPQFIPGLVDATAREGWLRLGVAYIDGRPAAAQIWLVCHGVASIYKLAYDEQYANLSVGSLLTAAMMRQAIDVDRVAEVDYLTGDEAYKRDWMSARRERWGMMVFNRRTVRGRLAALRHVGGGRLKKLVQGWAARRSR